MHCSSNATKQRQRWQSHGGCSQAQSSWCEKTQIRTCAKQAVSPHWQLMHCELQWPMATFIGNVPLFCQHESTSQTVMTSWVNDKYKRITINLNGMMETVPLLRSRIDFSHPSLLAWSPTSNVRSGQVSLIMTTGSKMVDDRNMSRSRRCCRATVHHDPLSFSLHIINHLHHSGETKRMVLVS